MLVAKRGWCRSHYCRWQRHGDPLGGRLGFVSAEERFEHYVNRTSDHWLWTGAVLNDRWPYGLLWTGERQVLAHRWSYEHFVGPIPTGLEIDHLCLERLCVRPDHLEPVTHGENVRRGGRHHEAIRRI